MLFFITIVINSHGSLSWMEREVVADPLNILKNLMRLLTGGVEVVFL